MQRLVIATLILTLFLCGAFAQTPQFTEPVFATSVPETFVEDGFLRPPDGFVQVFCRLEPGGAPFNGTYMITGPNADPFSLDPITGALSVTEDLDYETQIFYSFDVSCISSTDPTVRDTAVVEITIESVNEFLPVITSSSPVLFVTFDETREVGSIIVSRQPGEGIVQYSVNDGDDGPHGNVTFTFDDVNDPNDEMHFNLNFLTGELTLKETIDIDREGGFEIFGLTITACDSFPPTDTCPNLQINIQITAGNDNIPRFSQSSYNIQTPESTPLNTTFSVVECTDADVGAGEYEGIGFQNVTNPQTWTLVDDGDLQLIGQLDFETTQRYEFTLLCIDTGGLQDTATVTVNVSPVNDVPPVFNITEYSFTASRLSPLGNERVGQVTATDADLVVGNSITYSIQGDGNFAIDPDDGVITVSDYIFNFEGSSFELTVIASDGEFNATASVDIAVEGLLSIAEVIIISISGIVLIVIICICGCCCCYHFFPNWVANLRTIPTKLIHHHETLSESQRDLRHDYPDVPIMMYDPTALGHAPFMVGQVPGMEWEDYPESMTASQVPTTAEDDMSEYPDDSTYQLTPGPVLKEMVDIFHDGDKILQGKKN